MRLEKRNHQQLQQQTEPKETEAQSLIKMGKDGKYFTDDAGEAFVEIIENRKKHMLKIDSKLFKLLLGRRFYNMNKKPASPEAIKQAIHYYQSKAIFEGHSKKLSRRVAISKSGYIWYNLEDSKSRVVRVTPDGWDVYRNGPSLFYQRTSPAPQVLPNSNGDANLPRLLAKHLRTQNKSDLFLLAVYIVTCFVPDIPHPLLVLAGGHGAAKSSSIRMIRAIVDPAKSDLSAMPNSIDNLVILLNNNYMLGFDNLDKLTPEKSDLLCMASTGGTIAKRKLYTDDEETILQLKRCIMLNGINNVVTRPDLQDRSLIIEIERILPEDRKEEREVWSEFNADLPKILGACFDLLSKAMSIFPEVNLIRKPRMADFARWGYAVGQALGGLGNVFLDLFEKNQKRSSQEVMQSNPIATAIIKLMEDKETWESTPTAFYATLEDICKRNAIRLSGKNWPDSPNALTRRINNLKYNLEQVGITFETRKTNDRKVILTNENALQVRSTNSN